MSGLDDSELEKIKNRKLWDRMRSSVSGDDPKPQQSIDAPVDLTDANFDEFVKSHGLVIVDFWAEWCMPCRFMAPVVKDLAKEMAGRVVFAKLNVDENPRTAARFGIMSIPTFMVFRGGKPIDAIVGAMPKQKFKSMIERYLS
ncbi:MAG: thioredoxin [Thaumarchaeota archaeon]|nr:thioredoxin [Candidatus Calditenuaceae archaeon]MDW8186741.1 thioredoxin [Nitrososphaerota archaeon]